MGRGHITTWDEGKWSALISGEKDENPFAVLREVIASTKTASDSIANAAAQESD